MCFIEVDDHLAVLRHIGIEKPAGRVSFFAGRLVSKSEKQLVVFDRRLEPPGLASEFEFREPWSGIFLGHAQDIGDRNLMDWIIRMPLCANPELLVDGEPMQSRELAAGGTVRVAEPHSRASATLNDHYREASDGNGIRMRGGVGL